jgi:hypothetical protein
LLCGVVAPRWLLAGATARLSQVLQRLEPHAGEVDAAGGSGAWEAGGGCYSACLFLRDLHASLGRRTGQAQQAQHEGAELTFEERQEAAARLAAMLQEAAARWGLGGGEGAARQGGAVQQAAYARMSAELSKWVLSDSDGTHLLPLPQQDRVSCCVTSHGSSFIWLGPAPRKPAYHSSPAGAFLNDGG